MIRNLKTRLVLNFFFVTLLPLFLLAFFVEMSLSRTIQQRIIVENERLNASLIIDTQRFMANPVQSLSLIERSIREKTVPDGSVNEFLATMVDAHPYFEMIEILDADGRIVHVDSGHREFIGLDQSSEPFYSLAQKQSSHSWSPVFISPMTGEPTVALSRMFGDGMISAYVNLSDMGRIVDAVGLGARDYAAIVDAAGIFIAHTDHELVRTRRSETMLRSLQQQSPDKRTIRITLGGRSILVSRVPIPEVGWWVLVYRDARDAFAQLVRIRMVFGLTIMSLLAGVFVLSLRSASSIIAPLSLLRSRFRRISEGNYNVSLELDSYEELNDLARLFTIMAKDVRDRETRLVESEARVIDLNRDLERRVEERTAQLEQAMGLIRENEKRLQDTARMVALGELVAGVAHEINTPVGVCITASSFMQDSLQTLSGHFRQGKLTRQELENYLATAAETGRLVLENLERASGLIKSFKQIAVDQSSGERRVFELGQYLQEILDSLHPVLRKTGLSVKVDCPSGLQLDSYPGALFQIVSNLVMNSIMHGYPDGRAGLVLIKVARTDDSVRIVYSDDGDGIPPSILGRIFDPFFTTKRGEGGTGLGLNIVYNLVTQRLGGSIRCESEQGLGCAFILLIPFSGGVTHGE